MSRSDLEVLGGQFSAGPVSQLAQLRRGDTLVPVFVGPDGHHAGEPGHQAGRVAPGLHQLSGLHLAAVQQTPGEG